MAWERKSRKSCCFRWTLSRAALQAISVRLVYSIIGLESKQVVSHSQKRSLVCFVFAELNDHATAFFSNSNGTVARQIQKSGESYLFWGSKKNGSKIKKKRTTLGIPTWSPTVVLTEPEHA